MKNLAFLFETGLMKSDFKMPLNEAIGIAKNALSFIEDLDLAAKVEAINML